MNHILPKWRKFFARNHKYYKQTHRKTIAGYKNRTGSLRVINNCSFMTFFYSQGKVKFKPPEFSQGVFSSNLSRQSRMDDI